jgi:hypothetical protein
MVYSRRIASSNDSGEPGRCYPAMVVAMAIFITRAEAVVSNLALLLATGAMIEESLRME